MVGELLEPLELKFTSDQGPTNPRGCRAGRVRGKLRFS